MARRAKKQKSEQPTLPAQMRQAGLSPRREFLQLATADLLCLFIMGIIFWQTTSLWVLAGFPAVVILDYWLLRKAARLSKAKILLLEAEFVHIFAYFSIYVANGIPVYAALAETRRFASPDMSERLGKLLRAIDEDKTVTPYLGFVEGFPNLEMRQVLIAIYEMAEEGGSDAYVRQFQTIFVSLAANKRKEELESLKRNLSKLSFLPLLDSGVTMLLIVVGVVVVIGDLINGL